MTDGLWIIYLGKKGFVGLTLLYMAMVLPAALFIWRFPPRLWADPRLAAGSLTAVLLGLYVIDCLLNAFPNIIYIVLCGGLMGLEPRPALTRADDDHRLGRAFKAEGRVNEAEAVWSSTLDFLGTLIAAYPDRPDLRRRWCDCANDLAWLRLHRTELTHGDLSSVIALARAW